MDANELKDAISNLEKNLEGKSADAIKTEVKALKDSIDSEIKSLVEKAGEDAQKEIKELKELSEAQQKHLDKLDVKIQGGFAGINKTEKTFQTELKSLVRENFDDIKTVKKGHSVELELKTVGNMVSANVTGDLERDFSNVVAKVPNQKVNFSDLVQTMSISGGTYTFPREAAGEYSSGTAFRTQTEGSAKDQRDYDFTHVDVTTDFIAGFARYSKKMANNVQYLESFLPGALRRDYLKAESSIFNTALLGLATASTQVITSKNKPEMIINEIATLEALDHDVDGIVMTTSDYYAMLSIEKSTGAGYGLPLGWTFDGTVLRCLGIPVVKANWLAANKYYVGAWSTVKKIQTEGLSLQFSTEDADNFTKNNITARIEAQVGLAVHRPDAIIYGDFTAT
jgi:HK97 family phage major capsid protein